MKDTTTTTTTNWYREELLKMYIVNHPDRKVKSEISDINKLMRIHSMEHFCYDKVKFSLKKMSIFIFVQGLPQEISS